jgi:hypothetical protein
MKTLLSIFVTLLTSLPLHATTAHQSPIVIERGEHCAAAQAECNDSLRAAGALIWGRCLNSDSVSNISCDSQNVGKYDVMICTVERTADSKHCSDQTNKLKILVPKISMIRDYTVVTVPSIISETGLECAK